MTWKTFSAGVLLIVLALLHGIVPRVFSLDWPTVVLIALGVLFIFAPRLPTLLPYVKKLRLGEAEIEIREKLGEIRANVEQVEESIPTAQSSQAAVSVANIGLETTIVELASKDKAAALVRLAIELEKEMVLLYKEGGLELRQPTWRELVRGLTESGIVDPRLGQALIEFRDIRNKVIHSGFGGAVQESLLTSALDDGLRLLRLLRAIQR